MITTVQSVFTTRELKTGEYSVTEIWSKPDSALTGQPEQLIATAHSIKAAEEWVKIFENVPMMAMIEFYNTTTGTQLLSYLAQLGYQLVSHQIVQNDSDRVWHYVILRQQQAPSA